MGALCSRYAHDRPNVLLLTFALDRGHENKLLDEILKTGLAGFRDIAPLGGIVEKNKGHDDFRFGWWPMLGRNNVRPIVTEYYAKTDTLILVVPVRVCQHPVMLQTISEVTSRHDLTDVNIFMVLASQHDEYTKVFYGLEPPDIRKEEMKKSEGELVANEPEEELMVKESLGKHASKESEGEHLAKESTDLREILAQELVYFPGQSLHILRLQSNHKEVVRNLFRLVTDATRKTRRRKREENAVNNDKSLGAGHGYKMVAKFGQFLKSWLLY